MAQSATTKQSLDVVRRFNHEVFNGRNYDQLPELQAADYVQHGPMMGMELQGNDASLETMQLFHEAFSDLRAVEEFAFSDGEYVCTQYTYSGTHDGEFMGIPPTDESAEVRGIVINRIDDGEIAEAWIVVDFLGLFQQLGLVGEIDEIAG